jgi:ribosomal protein L37E
MTMSIKVLSDEDIAYIRKHYEPKHPEFGARALAKKFGVSPNRVSQLVRGKWQAEKHSNCIRCGIPLTKWQKKYCNKCGHETWRESNVERHRKMARLGVKRQRGKGEVNACEHLEWEANICLNCEKARCDNCLQLMSTEEKEELLKICGGKKWLD